MFYSNYPVTQSASRFMTKVYGWMAFGLAITAAISTYIAVTPGLFAQIFNIPGLFIILMLAQFGLVIALSGFIQKISYPVAIACYLGYSALTGVTLASIYFVYDVPSIVLSFCVAAGMFAFMAIYGTVTKSDLTAVGQLAIMGLFGLVLASFINWFVGSTTANYYLSYVGVGIFTLLIAYDAQKIKYMGQTMLAHGQMEGKVALLGALTLYLDFINLFLYLLRILGKNNDRK